MANKDREFNLTINNFEGFSPAYFSNSWSYIGNKGSANDMTDVDLSDENYITQGAGSVALTNGTQSGSVTTLITSILRTPTSNDVSWATGGNQIYKISSSAVSNVSPYPMTLNKDAVTDEDITDLIYYKSNIYLFYNHSGSIGDIAKLDISTNTLTADWGTTVPTGKGALISAPHYAILSGDDRIGFTNGNYIGTIDGTTLNTMALDFFVDSQAVAITYSDNRFIVGVNRPNISGSNFSLSAIYKWNGRSTSWDGDPIEVNGRIGALYTKNGTTFVWWSDGTGTGGHNFGYINGTQLSLIRRFTGTLPNQNQVGEYYGYIMWLNGAKVFMWGSGDTYLPVKMFHYMTTPLATQGALGAPFGDIMVSSNHTTSYALSKESGYSLNATYKTPSFDLTSLGGKAMIDKVKVITETIGTGGVATITLYYNDSTSNAKVLESVVAGKTKHLCLTSAIPVDNFKIGISWASGSTSNPVKIRAIHIGGTLIDEI